jgi:hypothetical protein
MPGILSFDQICTADESLRINLYRVPPVSHIWFGGLPYESKTIGLELAIFPALDV